MKIIAKLFILILFVGVQNLSAQTEVSGITLPESRLNESEENLELNGAGIREKFWMDLYVASMYVNTKNEDAAFYISGKEDILMNLDIVSGLITSEKMYSAIDEGFGNSAKNPSNILAGQIETFKNLFSAEPIEKGDQFTFSFVVGQGTFVYKNKKEIALLEGADFQNALFGIWLGNKPADKNLKKALLGQAKK